MQSAKHLLKVWSNIPISKISKQVYRKHMNSLISNYKYNTREGIHVVGKMIIDYAIDMDYLNINPTFKYAFPKDMNSIDSEDKLLFLEKDELIQFLEIIKVYGLYNDLDFFILFAYSGLRIGKAISLQWKDINFKNSSIFVNKTYYNPNNNKLNLNFKNLKYEALNEKS